MGCPEVVERIERWLDGESPPPEESEIAFHLAACASCRQRLRAARLVNEFSRPLFLPAPPGWLSRRVEARLLQQARRAMWTRRLVAAAALAASLVLATGIWFAAFRPRVNTPTASREPGRPAAVPSLQRQVEEAGQAFVSLTERAARSTVGESRFFLPPLAPPALSGDEVVLETLQPTGQSLEEIKRGMKAGLEPMADSARRAVDLFLGQMQKETAQRRGS
jgi:anti-sigma factor RsiW